MKRINIAGDLRRIRELAMLGEYYLTKHAADEMAEDGLDVFDVEESIINGDLIRIDADDPRGTLFTLAGYALDGLTRVGSVGRFTETGVYLIITVFEATEREDE